MGHERNALFLSARQTQAMTAADDAEADLPDDATAALDAHDAFTRVASSEDAAGGANRAAAALDGPAYAVASTGFDAAVTASEREGYADGYAVAVAVPSLDATTVDHVAPAVATGWFETMERRLAEAPKSTRAAVDLETFRLADADESGDELVVRYAYAFGDAARAVAIAKTFVEYVEGTYVESTVPGYEYEGVVGDLLASATSTGATGAGADGEGERGGTPL